MPSPPSRPITTHALPGGAAIAAGVMASLFFMRLFTIFPRERSAPSGRSWRGLLHGVRGLIDDAKRGGLNFRWKFLFQFIGAFLLVLFDIRIKFIEPAWLADALTVVWVVGVTNAFNIIDIMDGLSSSQAFVRAWDSSSSLCPRRRSTSISRRPPSRGERWHFCPQPFGAAQDFHGGRGLPFPGVHDGRPIAGNLLHAGERNRPFRAAPHPGLPLYDTFFVSFLRMKQGKSPFLGSKDHLALKLKALGLSRGRWCWRWPPWRPFFPRRPMS